MRSTLPSGTTALVSKWNTDDYVSLHKHNQETIICGSGQAGLKRAVNLAAGNPDDYKHIRCCNRRGYSVLNLDGTASGHPRYDY